MSDSKDTPENVEESAPYIIRPCGEISLVSDMAQKRVALETLSATAGLQRANFISALSATKDEGVAVMTVKYGNTSVSVNRDKAVLTSSAVKSELSAHPPGVHKSLVTAPPGSAPANKYIDGTPIPCGVCLIVAGGGTGKTPLAHALASAGVASYSTVRVGEPLSGYASSNESVAFSLAAAMIDSSDIVLDSIKDLLSSGGAAMKSGLSRDALVCISGWAAAACEAGCTIYVPVNPSTPDSEVLQLLAEAAKSNATMTIVSTSASSWTYSSRKGESLNRNAGTMQFSYDAKTGLGKVKVSSGTESKDGANEISRLISSVVSHSALSASMRRSITN